MCESGMRARFEEITAGLLVLIGSSLFRVGGLVDLLPFCD